MSSDFVWSNPRFCTEGKVLFAQIGSAEDQVRDMKWMADVSIVKNVWNFEGQLEVVKKPANLQPYESKSLAAFKWRDCCWKTTLIYVSKACLVSTHLKRLLLFINTSTIFIHSPSSKSLGHINLEGIDLVDAEPRVSILWPSTVGNFPWSSFNISFQNRRPARSVCLKPEVVLLHSK